jgi:hypothetical protein
MLDAWCNFSATTLTTPFYRRKETATPAHTLKHFLAASDRPTARAGAEAQKCNLHETGNVKNGPISRLYHVFAFRAIHLAVLLASRLPGVLLLQVQTQLDMK